MCAIIGILICQHRPIAQQHQRTNRSWRRIDGNPDPPTWRRRKESHIVADENARAVRGDDPKMVRGGWAQSGYGTAREEIFVRGSSCCQRARWGDVTVIGGRSPLEVYL